jgi:CheY-like chemotaxis protein
MLANEQYEPAGSERQEPRGSERRSVLVVDDDHDIAELVHAILTDDGYSVSVVHDQNPHAIRVAINKLEPDCVLLDGASPGEFGMSWDDAAWITSRSRPVPLVMFTAHKAAIREVADGDSERSRLARFSSTLGKPFDIDVLLDTVADAVGRTDPFSRTIFDERSRTAVLVERLKAAGARDIHASTRREWASFLTEDDTFVQVYWWERDGVYYLVSFALTGGRLETIGRFYDLGAAISVAMTVDADADGRSPVPQLSA